MAKKKTAEKIPETIQELNIIFLDKDKLKENDVTKAMNRLADKLTKANLWMYILRLLEEEPLYGYEIKEKIFDRFGFQPAVVSGYVILYKMKKDGLVQVEWKTSTDDGKPNRKYYQMTETGHQAMNHAKKYLELLIKSVFDKVEN
ncbi:MAG TPA: PadR family transcriptional regulator [Candidatus Deferrimicrobium sp.]|nr:PadR family transcriptional regulator [Candidatus Deferrimicrobium sp.]